MKKLFPFLQRINKLASYLALEVLIGGFIVILFNSDITAAR